MAEQTGLKAKATGLIDNIKYYWKSHPRASICPLRKWLLMRLAVSVHT